MALDVSNHLHLVFFFFISESPLSSWLVLSCTWASFLAQLVVSVEALLVASPIAWLGT
jgi:hypothetical protein